MSGAKRIAFLTAGFLFMLHCGADAAVSSLKLTEGQEEMMRGKVSGVSISSEGRVSLSRKLVPLLDTGESFVWSLCSDGKGNIYAGTGDGGKLFVIRSGGADSLLLVSQELEILSLAADRSGNIYAGTAPGGLILKITPQKQVSTFFATGDTYVWSLVFDDKDNLYAGTGTNGRIFKITPRGEGSVFFDSEETNIVFLAWDRNGRLLAGGEGNGTVLELTADGKGRLLFDPAESEVKALVADDAGNIYVFCPANSEEPKQGDPAGKPEAKEDSRASVYRIDAGLGTSRVLSVKDDLFLCAVRETDKSIIAGTGKEGRVYRITADGSQEIILTSEGSQVSALLQTSNGTIVAESNPGKVYLLSRAFTGEGRVESEVFDAKNTAKWGSLTWQGDTSPKTQVSFSTRCGNTEKVDGTWSEWTKEIPAPGEQIQSPPSRYLQWRMKLSAKDPSVSPSVTRVRFSYVQVNLPPEAKSVLVFPQGGEVFEGGPQSAPQQFSQRLPDGTAIEYSVDGPAPQPADDEALHWVRPLRTAVWESSDPNGDVLLFDLFIRAEGEAGWKVLKSAVESPPFTWSTAAFPDGQYYLKVIADDRKSNLPGASLTKESVSRSFLIDNTPPEVVSLDCDWNGKDEIRCRGKAEDALSGIRKIRYSLDGGEWMNAAAEDSIFDSGAEGFFFSTGKAGAGEHVVAVMAVDSAGNFSVRKTIVAQR